MVLIPIFGLTGLVGLSQGDREVHRSGASLHGDRELHHGHGQERWRPAGLP